MKRMKWFAFLLCACFCVPALSAGAESNFVTGGNSYSVESRILADAEAAAEDWQSRIKSGAKSAAPADEAAKKLAKERYSEVQAEPGELCSENGLSDEQTADLEKMAEEWAGAAVSAGQRTPSQTEEAEIPGSSQKRTVQDRFFVYPQPF